MSNKMLARKILTPTTLRAGGGGRAHIGGYFDTTLALLYASPSLLASQATRSKRALQFNRT